MEYECHGNAVEACYLIIDGPITKQTVAAVEEMMQAGLESFKVLMNSNGGDLNAGITVGRAIRNHNFETRIGVYQDKDLPLAGQCLSACAYAFLGGTQRIVGDESRIGFHQFAIGGSTELEGLGGLIVGQRLSASVIAYMVEMGVDARLFAIASETAFSGMYFPDREERVQYDVETPLGFGHFFMEPYGNGVVIASKRLGPTHPYDRVDHLTVYCKGGRARVLLTVSGENQFVPDPSYASFEVAVANIKRPDFNQWTIIDLNRSDIRTWSTAAGAYIDMAFNAKSVPITEETQWFRASFFTSRADGGSYQAIVNLNDMDRQMLRAAFRMCI